MEKRRKKRYNQGDQIHISVVAGFERDATEFFDYCHERGYNPSKLIRALMRDWLLAQKKKDAAFDKSREGGEAAKRMVDSYEESILFEK